MPAELSQEQRLRRRILEQLPEAVRASSAKPFVCYRYIPVLQHYDQEYSFTMLDILEHEGRVHLRRHDEDRAVSLTPKGKQSLERTEEDWQASATPTFAPQVHISGHFHQSPIGIGSNITQSVTGGTFDQEPVFRKLRDAIANMPNEDDREQLRAGVEAMETAHDTPEYVGRYANFVQLAANHMTVVSPFLSALTALLTGQ